MKAYTPQEASRLLNVSIQTLRRWDKTGRIKTIRTSGGQRRYPREEVARLIGCTPEELENREIEALRPEGDVTDELRDKRREIEGLELEVKKEGLVKRLLEVKGDPDVRRAESELQILKIQKEKEKLLAEERKREMEEKARERKERWLGGCLRFMDYCINPVKYDLPDFYHCPDSELIDYITPDIRVKIKKAVLEVLGDYDPGSDPEEVRLAIQKTVRKVMEECLSPIWKEENIEIALGTLVANSLFPLWMDEGMRGFIIDGIEKVLREKTTGLEDETEVIKMAEKLKEKMVMALQEERGKK